MRYVPLASPALEYTLDAAAPLSGAFCAGPALGVPGRPPGWASLLQAVLVTCYFVWRVQPEAHGAGAVLLPPRTVKRLQGSSVERILL